jgi:hypothetical protein
VTSLICTHCNKLAGRTDGVSLWFKGHDGAIGAARRWNGDPVTLGPVDDPAKWPVRWHCPRCGWDVALGRPPWPHRVLLPADPPSNTG